MQHIDFSFKWELEFLEIIAKLSSANTEKQQKFQTVYKIEVLIPYQVQTLFPRPTYP